MSNISPPWYAVQNVEEIASPALLLYPARIEENIRRMIALAGGVERLRPHVKTHKLAPVVLMQLAAGITKFKTATIAEAEMTARAGAPDVLLAYQPVGPNVARVGELVRRFPATQFSTIVDSSVALRALSQALATAGQTIDVLLDIDPGMGRCGIRPGDEAARLYRELAHLPGVRPGGLHVYDGHIHDRDHWERAQRCETAFAPVLELRDALLKTGLPVPWVVAGGTPTFPLHAPHADRQCSPGTCLLWDAGYTHKLPDLDFLPAAVVLGRVISRPSPDRLCLDIGYKAVSADSPQPRIVFPDLPDAQPVVHSEEHLTLQTSAADRFPLGTPLYGIPWHICPTVALHAEGVVIRNGQAVQRWPIDARNRVLSL